MKVRVLFAFGPALIRAGVKSVLKDSEFDVVGQATSYAETIELVRAMQPKILLLDVLLKHENGLDTLKQIRLSHPEIGIIMMADINTPALVAQANLLGARDYLIKDLSEEELIDSLRRVARNEEAPECSLMRKTAAMMMRDKRRGFIAGVRISNREQQVLRHIAIGFTNQEIAAALGISVYTVKEHVENLLRKTCCRDRTAAAVWAFSCGLMEVPWNSGL